MFYETTDGWQIEDGPFLRKDAGWTRKMVTEIEDWAASRLLRKWEEGYEAGHDAGYTECLYDNKLDEDLRSEASARS